ncbi:universal stress protein [Synechococcales cyanobacterium C]|uniref:Universal stress protein n=1 Tax=Petrachloros mirabilis ULC683 TaxID=2781853 RepID=A0A8K2ACH9_9CYAN|nr:universal stress protein [Petrachloros mirabilis]NCJ05404.1 universal stress protein [Petrachloros mirabilis ULC683]
MFKTVLFPVDHSRGSQDAAKAVAEIVKFCGSRLIILSVEDSGEEAEAHPGLSPEVIEQLLTSAKSTFSEWGIDAETLHRKGKPAFCICDVADELQVDLIVMGCRGIGLTEEGAADSVSNRVINLSPCPVLVVP